MPPTVMYLFSILIMNRLTEKETSHQSRARRGQQTWRGQTTMYTETTKRSGKHARPESRCGMSACRRCGPGAAVMSERMHESVNARYGGCGARHVGWSHAVARLRSTQHGRVRGKEKGLVLASIVFETEGGAVG